MNRYKYAEHNHLTNYSDDILQQQILHWKDSINDATRAITYAEPQALYLDKELETIRYATRGIDTASTILRNREYNERREQLA